LNNERVTGKKSSRYIRTFLKVVLKPQVLVVGYAALIFILSSIPHLTPPKLEFILFDKVIHFILYSFLSYLLFFAFFKTQKSLFHKNAHLFSISIGILYALTDELHQKFVPGRSCDFFDFLADGIGVVLIQIILWWRYKTKTKKDEPAN
jgi:VanZ family protein